MRLLILLAIVHQIIAETPPVQLNADRFSSCINPFSLDILKKLDYGKKNVIYSPLSIGMTLGMVLEGAQGEDRQKLFKLLNCANYGNRDTAIHQQFKALLDEYKDMANRESKPRNVTVELANLLMYKEGLLLPVTFIDALKKDYEASVASEDFATKGQQVVDKINKFVSERTHGLIPQVFQNPLDPQTIMVLINTIFFKAYWETFFRNEVTYNATFYNADKTEKTVRMMQRSDVYLDHYYCQKHKASFVEIPYLGEMSMYLIVPDERYGLPNVIQALERNEFMEILPKMNNTNVDIYLPKFEFDFSIDLMKVFSDLGVDIKNVLKPVHNSVKITGAVHKAKIRTHETGTEASAVTILIGAGSALKPPPKEIKADHPFLFLILDKKSKVNIFTGVVNQFQ